CGGSLVSLFFSKAEAGIRDWSVTGVQTCALPIWRRGEVRVRLGEIRIERERARERCLGLGAPSDPEERRAEVAPGPRLAGRELGRALEVRDRLRRAPVVQEHGAEARVRDRVVGPP